MEAAIFFLSCIVIAALIFFLVNPKSYWMTKREKEIFEAAMREIDSK